MSASTSTPVLEEPVVALGDRHDSWTTFGLSQQGLTFKAKVRVITPLPSTAIYFGSGTLLLPSCYIVCDGFIC
jgi:hypothetical protein